jgi:hypothetical protein
VTGVQTCALPIYQDIKIGNRCFENVAQFRYLGMTITNQNLIEEKIKRILYLGNAYYHSVQNLLSSRLLSKSVKIRIHKTVTFPAFSYGCETRFNIEEKTLTEDV